MIARSRPLFVILFLALVLGSGLTTFNLAQAQTTFVVNSTGDAPDADTTDNVCDAGGGECTLRAAIEQANATPGADAINFDIPGPGAQTIAPTTNLPPITESVTIDGYSQPGASPNTNGPLDGGNAVILIEVNGFDIAATGGFALVQVRTTDVTIKGLLLNGQGDAIYLDGDENNVGRNVIQGNYFGTDFSGTTPTPSGFNIGSGVGVSSTDNLIGGPNPEDRNLFVSGGWSGVSIIDSDNVVMGNFIGTDVTGTVPFGYQIIGLEILGSSNNQIGGSEPGEGNLILGELLIAYPFGGGNRIIGNRIGTDVTGTFRLGSGGGISILESSGNIVGGTAEGEGNTIDYIGDGVIVGCCYSRQPAGTMNTIRGNSIRSATGFPINNSEGGNLDLPPPVLETVVASGVSGTACSLCEIDVFSESGYVYLGSTQADASGNWSFALPVVTGLITASATDEDGNTSEYAQPQPIDTSDQCFGETATILGTPGDDVLQGTSGTDVIVGLGGNDMINGKAGNDFICAGDGNSTIKGGAGGDTILAFDGDYTIDGGPSNDLIFAGDGDMIIDGGAGNDSIHTQRGRDSIDGGSGSDIVSGGGSPNTEGPGDQLVGGAGHDILCGGFIDEVFGTDCFPGQGNETVEGGAGNDRITTSEGDDTIDAGAGNDVVDCGPGDDTADSGAGTDENVGNACEVFSWQ